MSGLETTRVRLRGINGCDEIDVDLSGLPEGLIGVWGRNGAGKTTLLEAMLPVPLTLSFPSRDGNLYRRVGTRRDNQIETWFSYGGDSYRARIDIDPGTGRSGQRVDAYLFRNGEPVTGTEKGDIAGYLAAMRDLFPAPDVVLASVFSSQSRKGNLLEMARADRRALFADLLNLGELEVLAQRARLRRKVADGELRVIESGIEDLARELARMSDVDGELTTARQAEASARSAVDVARADMDPIAARFASLSDAANRRRGEIERHERRIRDLEASIASRSKRIAAAEDRLRVAVAAEDSLADLEAECGDVAAAERAEADARAALAAMRERRAALNPTIRSAREALERAEALSDVELARRQLASAEQALSGAGEAPDLDTVRSALAQARADVATRRAELAELGDPVSEVAAIEARLEAARAGAGLLDAAPCGGGVVQAMRGHSMSPVDCGACPLLGSAARDRDAIPGLEADLAAASALVLAITDARAAAELAAADEVSAARAVHEAEIAIERRARLSTAVDSAREAVAAAEKASADATSHRERLAELTVERDEIDREGGAASERSDLASAELARIRKAAADLELARSRAGDVDAARGDLEALRRELADGRAALDEERANRPPADTEADAELAAVAEQLEAARARVTAAEAARDEAAREAARIEGRLSELTRRREAHDAAVVRRDGLASRRAAFDVVARGFAREGYQAMEIDRASPRVADLTNSLLGETFGGRFSVRFVTASPRADGKGTKPDFDVEIIDGASGSVRSGDDLSGGERLIVSEAIKLGIAIFNAERDGVSSATLWRDECDGAFDPEAAAAYAPMLRRALALGGFARCFFITHRQDVIDQADAVLRAVPGGFEVDIP